MSAERDVRRLEVRHLEVRRLEVQIQGAVQGVGFRPFVFRLAHDHGLTGWVVNDGRGVCVEVEGKRQALQEFLDRLHRESPPRAAVHRFESVWREPAGYASFEIRDSDVRGARTVVVLPDVATCAHCLAEIRDPVDRRFAYPFTNCTDCGPRFSIVESVPYDRPNTTMRGFEMCPRCAEEYRDPLDRRFHAQPNACPECGPTLELWDRSGRPLQRGGDALAAAARRLKEGGIVAVKGLGGFHLMVDARRAARVVELRRRKGREAKPFAVMVADLDRAREIVVVSEPMGRLLASHEAPIVILDRRPGASVAFEVAPDNPTLGVMLPSTPLHHLLLAELPFPVVATSGNLSDEPIAIDNHEAVARLGAIADAFLVHDRPIARPVDDSVVTLVSGAPQPIRRARGQAPMPIALAASGPPVLALGGHFKSTVAVAFDDRAVLSQHLGDMETPQAFAAFERAIPDLLAMYDVRPEAIACDAHPDYPTSRFARRLAAGEAGAEPWKRRLAGLPLIEVQHHHAHLAACLAEHPGASRHAGQPHAEQPQAGQPQAGQPCLGITWDGTGYGTDGTVWGGEFLVGDDSSYERVARLRPFRLLGGEAAVRQPWRVALALLWELMGEEALAQVDLSVVADHVAGQESALAHMATSGLRSPWTSSAGRLFDGVAALLDLVHRADFEGQAAMQLEIVARAAPGALDPGEATAPYPFVVDRAPAREPILELDWRPLVSAALADVRAGRPPSRISARFHDGLVAAIRAVALEIARTTGVRRIALTGGCFQNRRLTEGARAGLDESGFEVMIHRRVPTNDGGLSLGQLVVARARLQRETLDPGRLATERSPRQRSPKQGTATKGVSPCV